MTFCREWISAAIACRGATYQKPNGPHVGSSYNIDPVNLVEFELQFVMTSRPGSHRGRSYAPMLQTERCRDVENGLPPR